MKSQQGEVVHKITVSSVTILKIVAILAGLVFAWYIREVLFILFASLILAAALDPWVDKMESYRIPRGVSIAGLYLTIIGFAVALAYLIIPPLVQQSSEIVDSFSQYAPQIDSFYQTVTQRPDVSFIAEVQNYLSDINRALADLTAPVTETVTIFMTGLGTLLVVLVITLYMTIEEDGIKKFVRSVAPIQYQPYLVQKTNRVQEKMGAWMRGQLITMTLIGILSWIALYTLGVEYALVLAIFAGFAEFIPFIGPLISAVPAVFFAYADSPWKALAVMIAFLIIQQLENQVITPKVMNKAVGLNPIVVIASMLVGHLLIPYAGIILAVPAATIIWVFLEDVVKMKQKRDEAMTD
jgi:predicted PurR-regulated permease PerM